MTTTSAIDYFNAMLGNRSSFEHEPFTIDMLTVPVSPDEEHEEYAEEYAEEYEEYEGYEEEEEEEGGELTLTLTRIGSGRKEVIEFMDPAHLLHILTRECSYDEYIPDWFASADRDMIRSLLLDELRGAEDTYYWSLSDSSGPISVRALVDLYHPI